MNWAENHARKIIEKFPDEEEYVCASGITPSGFIHVGNFREYFTVEAVVNELKKLGKKVRHIHSWDNFDPLRKVPKNIPEERKEEYKGYIGRCISQVPDPWGQEKSYADHFMKRFEKELNILGCSAEYLDQYKLYSSCTYKEGIKQALNNKEKIIEIYNKFRKEPVSQNWWPITAWCDECKKNTDIILDYDGNYTVKYKCKHCSHVGETNFAEKGNIKLRWRIDWPMRWDHYNEHFEPSGKDHMSSGGSNDMAKLLMKEVYNKKAPYAFMYEFIGIKGGDGKMSSSTGNIYTISDIIKYYPPEIFRYLYVSSKPSSPFSIQLDENIFQIYNAFYRIENIYYSKEDKESNDNNNNNKDSSSSNNKNSKNDEYRKQYEISNINRPEKLPHQPKLQEFIILSQVLGDDAVDFYIKNYNITDNYDINRINQIKNCASNWIKDLAPEKYIYKDEYNYDEDIKNKIIDFFENIQESDNYQQDFYKYMKDKDVNIKKAFETFYILFFNKKVGPKLGNIVDYYGSDKVFSIIKENLKKIENNKE